MKDAKRHRPQTLLKALHSGQVIGYFEPVPEEDRHEAKDRKKGGGGGFGLRP